MRIRGEREKIKPKQFSSNSDHLSKSSPLSSNPFHQHINESEYLEYTDVILQTNRFFIEVFGNVLSPRFDRRRDSTAIRIKKKDVCPLLVHLFMPFFPLFSTIAHDRKVSFHFYFEKCYVSRH